MVQFRSSDNRDQRYIIPFTVDYDIEYYKRTTVKLSRMLCSLLKILFTDSKKLE